MNNVPRMSLGGGRDVAEGIDALDQVAARVVVVGGEVVEHKIYPADEEESP